jgi:hypothetical protein
MLYLYPGIDLVAVQGRLQVMQFVRVGLLTEYRGAVIVGEGQRDGVGIVQEVQHKGIRLLRSRPVQPG